MIKLTCPHCNGKLELEFAPLLTKLEKGNQDWRRIPREEMGLSTRAENSLKFGGFGTAGELDDATDRDLLRTANFGQRSLWEVRDKLARLKGLQEEQG